MKRIILGNSRSRQYLVSEITEYAFPGMVAFNVINTDNKLDLADRGNILLEYVEPNRAILVLHEASADNILEELSDHYRKNISPKDVADVLSNDGCSGLLAERDGILVLVSGHFKRYSAE